jgi:ribonuclease HII
MHTIICGVDEVGRGPIAGNVFAAACILPKLYKDAHTFCLPNNLALTDSKKISAKKREIISNYLSNHPDVIFSIQQASVEEIDSLNILQASLLAMQRCVESILDTLQKKQCLPQFLPTCIQIDGTHIPKKLLQQSIPCQAIIQGDLSVAEISAASILAKVARDKYMCDMHNLYPMYFFNQNMGYPSVMHKKALRQYGACPIHRKSFAPVAAILNKIY